MSTLRAFWMRLRGVFVAMKAAMRDFAAELESHLQMHIEDNLRAGMSPQEARRQALIKLGGIEQTREAYRERQSSPGSKPSGKISASACACCARTPDSPRLRPDPRARHRREHRYLLDRQWSAP